MVSALILPMIPANVPSQTNQVAHPPRYTLYHHMVLIHNNTKLLNFSGLCKCVVRFLYCLLKLPDEIGAGNCKQSGKEVLLTQ